MLQWLKVLKRLYGCIVSHDSNCSDRKMDVRALMSILTVMGIMAVMTILAVMTLRAIMTIMAVILSLVTVNLV